MVISDETCSARLGQMEQQTDGGTDGYIKVFKELFAAAEIDMHRYIISQSLFLFAAFHMYNCKSNFHPVSWGCTLPAPLCMPREPHTAITNQWGESKEKNTAIEKNIRKVIWNSKILKNKSKDSGSNFLAMFSSSKAWRVIEKREGLAHWRWSGRQDRNGRNGSQMYGKRHWEPEWMQFCHRQTDGQFNTSIFK